MKFLLLARNRDASFCLRHEIERHIGFLVKACIPPLAKVTRGEAVISLQAGVPSLCVQAPRGLLSLRWTPETAGGSHLILNEQRPTALASDLERLGLSRREAEVLHWLAEGKTNAAIAVILGASPRTVEKHVERIFAKLGVETRMEAALQARNIL